MKKLAALRLLSYSLLLQSSTARAQLEGTLFTEPEEREYLDYLRNEFMRNNAANVFDVQEVEIPDIPDATATQTETGPVEYSFGGAMTGREGIRVWLNGRLLAESELPEGFSVVQSSRNVSLRIVNNGKTYLLLPGQTVDVTTGNVVENFQRPLAPTAEDSGQPSASVNVAADPAEIAAADASQLAVERSADEATSEEPDPSVQNEDFDSAVADLSDAEAAELAAALERRRTQQPEAQVPTNDSDDAP